MADEIDRATGIIAKHDEDSITAVVQAVNAPGTLICEVCDAVIPARRREAYPAARTCVPCQQAMETRRVR